MMSVFGRRLIASTRATCAAVAMTHRQQLSSDSPVWKLGRLNHVAVATPDLAKTSGFYRDVLGAKVSGAEDLLEHGVTTVFVELDNTKIELLHPFGPKSPIKGFLDKNTAGGIHHICIEVDDIEAAVKSVFTFFFL